MLVRGAALVVMAAVSGNAMPGGGQSTERAADRETMVRTQIESRGIRDRRTLEAMRRVPRHLFVPAALQASAYADTPLPIGHAQTISQPYIVAFMTEGLGLTGAESVLEIGTGSGYQAAVLAEMARSVRSIEIVVPLAEEARARLAALGYRSVEVRTGDGSHGWPEAAPFDAIMVTAAAPVIPKILRQQLRDGGRLILPVDTDEGQELVLVTRRGERFEERRLLPVRFVPMTGDVRR